MGHNNSPFSRNGLHHRISLRFGCTVASNISSEDPVKSVLGRRPVAASTATTLPWTNLRTGPVLAPAPGAAGEPVREQGTLSERTENHLG